MANEPKPRHSSPWLVPAVVLAVAGVLIALIIGNVMQSAAPTDTHGAAEAPTQVEGPDTPDLSIAETRDPDDVLAVGPVDAPVVMVFFSDYQCPFCARWNYQTLPAMMEHVEAGDLRIEWRDVNVFGPESERAARAAYAAALQDRFLDYNNALFEDGKHRPKDQLTDNALIELADELGLDTEQFTTDFNSDKAADIVADNEKQGLDLGVNATPAFVIGGQPIMGAQPTSVFEDAFQAALDSAE